ncbi:unnamed protein product, partial [Mesorhabditis belari]|uniref:Uncharacterized protein n=1 Tax=Mesorhabditis belari TaxID=2138241 RepID=A0AAF3F7K4_9BILA
MTEEEENSSISSEKSHDETTKNEKLDENKDNDSDEDEEKDKENNNNTRMDWAALLKMAEEAEAELEEVLLPPIQHHINNLEKGREVSKLASIRALPEMIEDEGDPAIEALLPSVQRCLREEASNLDVHCEAAVVFKSILQSEKLTRKHPGLTEKLLKNILENIQQQKDNMSAAAWLETLVDIADRIDLQSVKTYIVPVVQQQSEPNQRIQRRIIATKLLHKLATILPAVEIRKELGTCTQLLCEDPNANVRSGMAQRIAAIAKSFNTASESVSLVLPCLVSLVGDEEAGVREAALNAIAPCIPTFTKEAKKSTVLPLIRKCTDQAITKADEQLAIVAKNFGEWAYSLKEVMDALDKSWVLNTYLRMVSWSQPKEGKTAREGLLGTLVRRACAYNYPCLLVMFPKAFERLLPILEAFCGDPDDEVRVSIASSYHEIVQLYPNKVQLIPPFIELVRSGATEVVAKITFNLDKMLPILYKCARQKEEDGPKVSAQQLDRILIGCNVLLRGSGAWRSHEAYLNALAVLTQVLNYHQLFDTFVPILQKEVLTVRANPCRVAAVSTLLLFMKEHPDREKREIVIDFLKNDILKHDSCYRRSVFVDVAECVLKMFSRRFFKQYFLTETLSLARDRVANIRLRLAKLLPKIKATIVLPDDDSLLLQMEKTVRDMLSKEDSPQARTFVQGAACNLSRADSGKKSDKEDEKRMEEEDKLWNDESRVIEKNRLEMKPPSGLRPPSTNLKNKETKEETTNESKEASSSLSTSSSFSSIPLQTSSSGSRLPSTWRTQRRAIAVVRPQPIVVMRSPSPVPSAADVARKSRLPLSTAYSTATSSLERASRTLSKLPSSCTSSSSLSSRSSSMDRRGSLSSLSSTSSLNSSSMPSYSYRSSGLQRSATSSTIAGSGLYSSVSTVQNYPLMSSRSMSQIRRPVYGLTKVSSQSDIVRKPPQMRMSIRTAN